MRTRRAPRPNATLLCRRIAADMATKLPELSHVKPGRILFVAGEARPRVPRHHQAPGGDARCSLRGKRALYLRQPSVRSFFSRQHTRAAGGDAGARAPAHLRRVRRAAPPRAAPFAAAWREVPLALAPRWSAGTWRAPDPGLLSGLGHHGEMVARQWLERPTGNSSRGQAYSEKHLFLGLVQMITPPPLALVKLEIRGAVLPAFRGHEDRGPDGRRRLPGPQRGDPRGGPARRAARARSDGSAGGLARPPGTRRCTIG